MAKSDSHKIPKWLKLEEGEEYVRGFRISSVEAVLVVFLIILYSTGALGIIWAGSVGYGTLINPTCLLALMTFYNALLLILFYKHGCVTAHLTSNNLFVLRNYYTTSIGFAKFPLDSVLSVQLAGRSYEYGTVRIIFNRNGKRRRYNVSIEDYEGFINIVSTRITSLSAQDNPVAKECNGNA